MLLCFGGFNSGSLDFLFFDSFIDFQWDYVIRFKLFTIDSEYRKYKKCHFFYLSSPSYTFPPFWMNPQ